MKITFLTICFSLLFCLSLVGQTLTPEQLQADFNRFRTALNEAHPEMYRYTPKPAFDSLFTATAAKLNRPMTQHEFYVTMLPLLVALRDGHIKWIVSGRDEHYPFFTDKLFPLKLYFLGEKAWVVGSYGNTNVPTGAAITSINGQSISAIIRKLLPNMTFADGDRIGGKYEDLNQYFSGFYATHFGGPDAFTITYQTGNDEKSAMLPAVTEKTIKDYVESHKPAVQPPFRVTFLDNGGSLPQTAIVTIERFYTDKGEQDYSTFLKEAFAQIKQKQIKNVVLDLRNNEGGEESYGVQLYAYLAEKPFRYYDHISVRQKHKFSFPVWTSKLYLKMRWLVVKKRGDGYVFTYQRGLKTVKPERDAFHGNLYILLNGNSFSVTTEFAARAHADKRATFIGQESGGGYALNSSGIFAITQLPNSKIDLGIGMFGFHMANLPNDLKPGQGIVPDHIVEPTAEDVLSGHDRAMEYTLNLIQGQKAALTKSE
ncbi:peptidase S41 [Fibrisoma limi BUZ 3]|uniref:Peptidase S41 n=1 Tax=Fibrisoma limi BUZ 3 TaxID=1185876 RepID=I2GE64_9BACT|nr:S41 family peptidase [Fibrisoma limi]CCH52189.1 peptidase S41 [Fibrisoma limi BUZ 3]